MLDFAHATRELRALVTGHYARVANGEGADSPVPLLRIAADRLKDQSYALAGLDTRFARALSISVGRA